jgi:hypothetical protein
VEELHAAITAYLRRHNPRYVTPCPPPVPFLPGPRCRDCGARIVAEGEPFALAQLVAARRCVHCYLREAA